MSSPGINPNRPNWQPVSPSELKPGKSDSLPQTNAPKDTKMGTIPDAPSKSEAKKGAANTKWVPADTTNKAPKVAPKAQTAAFLNSLSQQAAIHKKPLPTIPYTMEQKAELKALKEDIEAVRKDIDPIQKEVGDLKESMQNVKKDTPEWRELGLKLFWAEEKLNVFVEDKAVLEQKKAQLEKDMGI